MAESTFGGRLPHFCLLLFDLCFGYPLTDARAVCSNTAISGD